MAKGALHAASSVWASKMDDFSTRMNEYEFWRNNDTGMHDWNVVLLRKVEKNFGHEGLVKLLPNEVSKAEGRDVVTTVTDGVEVLETVVGGRDEESASVEDASGASEVLSGASVVLLLVLVVSE